MNYIADTDYRSHDRFFLRWYSEPGCLQFNVEIEETMAHLRVLEFNDARYYDKIPEDEWIVRIDAELDCQEIIDAVILDVERNIRKHGFVGFSRDWCCHRDELGISDYLYLKGIRTKYHDDDTQTSQLEKEIEILNTLPQEK